MRRHLLVVLVVALVAVGCSSDDAELSTTTTLVAGGTSAPGDTTPEGNGENGNGENAEGGTTTTLRGQPITEHRQVYSEETPNGPVIHLVVPRLGYTDADVENFIRDLRESQPGLWGVELFDNDDAQAAFVIPAAQRTEEQRTVLTRYHLVSLTEGETLVWRGPFSSLGQSTIGS